MLCSRPSPNKLVWQRGDVNVFRSLYKRSHKNRPFSREKTIIRTLVWMFARHFRLWNGHSSSEMLSSPPKMLQGFRKSCKKKKNLVPVIIVELRIYSNVQTAESLTKCTILVVFWVMTCHMSSKSAIILSHKSKSQSTETPLVRARETVTVHLTRYVVQLQDVLLSFARFQFRVLIQICVWVYARVRFR